MATTKDMHLSKKTVFALFILLCGIILAAGLRQLKPEPTQRQAAQIIPSVVTTTIKTKAITLHVESHGTVQAKHRSDISSEATGRIEFASDNFLQGAFVNQGELLLRIENSEYIAAVADAEATLLAQQLDLKDKKARYEKNSLSVKQQQSATIAAQKRLAAAQRNLKNTEIRAAFNGIIDNKRADIGQFVAKGQILFTLSSTDKAEVRLPIALSDIQHISADLFQKSLNTQVELSTVIGSNRKRVSRNADSVRLEAGIDATTRVFYLSAEVVDPYSRRKENNLKTPLAIGLFVNASIATAAIPNAVELPLALLQSDNTVYLLQQGQLIKRKVTVAHKQKQYAIISAGLNTGDKLVTTLLPIMYAGMAVQTQVDSQNDEQPDDINQLESSNNG